MPDGLEACFRFDVDHDGRVKVRGKRLGNSTRFSNGTFLEIFLAGCVEQFVVRIGFP